MHFDNEFTCKEENGVLTFGDIVIDTYGHDEDEYDDEEYDWEEEE